MPPVLPRARAGNADAKLLPSSLSRCSQELLLVRCLAQIGVTSLVTRYSGAAGARWRRQNAGARGPGPARAKGARPLYLLNLQLRNSIMKDRRFFLPSPSSFFHLPRPIDPRTQRGRQQWALLGFCERAGPHKRAELEALG